MTCQTSDSWVKTRYNDIVSMAELMGVSVKQAFAIRDNFINETIKSLNQDIEDDAVYLMNCFDEIEFRFYLESIAAKMKQITKLERSRAKKPTEGMITDSDIEVARHYPVEKLIEFKHGKATAFCHDDRSPSLFHGTRFNIAVCPVCAMKFGAIDILIQRDGYSFKDAVKHLAEA